MTKHKNITSSNLTYDKTSKFYTVEIIIFGVLKFYDNYLEYEKATNMRTEKEKELFIELKTNL